MRLAVNATILDDKPTGLGVYTLNLIRELSKVISKNDQLIVFTSCSQVFKGLNVETRRVPRCLQPQHGVVAGILRFFWIQCVYPWRILREGCDIVYSTTHHAVFFLPLAQVMTLHDLLPLKFPARYRLQYFYFKFILPVLIKRCIAIVAISENTREDILQYYKTPPTKVPIVHNAYDENLFSRERGQGHITADYILAVGASYMNKNLERLMEAYKLIEKQIDHRLVIVGGRKDYVQLLRKKANQLGITGRVDFLDHISAADLPALYRHARLFVFPSLYEGFGIPLLEAMAMGCPVVAAQSSSIPEVCGEAAFYVDPTNTESIAQGMLSVLKNTELRNVLIKKGLERVKLFSWKKSSRKVYDILKNLPSGKKIFP